MIIGVVIQQPSDNLDYDIDVSNLIEGGDTLDTVSCTVSPAGLAAVPFKIDDSTSKVWVSGGTAGVEYKIEVTHTTGNGRIREDELVVKVEEF